MFSSFHFYVFSSALVSRGRWVYVGIRVFNTTNINTTPSCPTTSTTNTQTRLLKKERSTLHRPLTSWVLIPHHDHWWWGNKMIPVLDLPSLKLSLSLIFYFYHHRSWSTFGTLYATWGSLEKDPTSSVILFCPHVSPCTLYVYVCMHNPTRPTSLFSGETKGRQEDKTLSKDFNKFPSLHFAYWSDKII